MLQIKMKQNIKTFLKHVEQYVDSATMMFRAGMYNGMRLFEGEIIKKQMSVPRSRKSYTFGLKRQTGTLARSWFITTENAGNDFKIKLATSTSYGIYHEE